MFMLHVLTTCNKHTNKEFVIYSALSVSIIKMYFDYALWIFFLKCINLDQNLMHYEEK